MNYRLVNMDRLLQWLKDNKIKYKLIPMEPGKDEIGNVIFFIEVYSARAETAIRIKWQTV